MLDPGFEISNDWSEQLSSRYVDTHCSALHNASEASSEPRCLGWQAFQNTHTETTHTHTCGCSKIPDSRRTAREKAAGSMDVQLRSRAIHRGWRTAAQKMSRTLSHLQTATDQSIAELNSSIATHETFRMRWPRSRGLLSKESGVVVCDTQLWELTRNDMFAPL